MQITENFTLEEFTRSSTAEKHGIDNESHLTEQDLDNIKYLARHALQPIRDAIGRLLGHDNYYISITSGYRCPKLNGKIGGSRKSFHLYGMAADCELYVDGKECNALLFHVAKVLGLYTELIWEYGRADKPHTAAPAWVHIALAQGDNRNMIKYIG